MGFIDDDGNELSKGDPCPFCYGKGYLDVCSTCFSECEYDPDYAPFCPECYKEKKNEHLNHQQYCEYCKSSGEYDPKDYK